MGAAVSVALFVEVEAAVLTSALLIAPRKKNAPGVGHRAIEERVGGDGDGGGVADTAVDVAPALLLVDHTTAADEQLPVVIVGRSGSAAAIDLVVPVMVAALLA